MSAKFKLVCNRALPKGAARWAVVDAKTGETAGYERSKKAAEELARYLTQADRRLRWAEGLP